MMANLSLMLSLRSSVHVSVCLFVNACGRVLYIGSLFKNSMHVVGIAARYVLDGVGV